MSNTQFFRVSVFGSIFGLRIRIRIRPYKSNFNKNCPQSLKVWYFPRKGFHAEFYILRIICTHVFLLIAKFGLVWFGFGFIWIEIKYLEMQNFWREKNDFPMICVGFADPDPYHQKKLDPDPAKWYGSGSKTLKNFLAAFKTSAYNLFFFAFGTWDIIYSLNGPILF